MCSDAAARCDTRSFSDTDTPNLTRCRRGRVDINHTRKYTPRCSSGKNKTRSKAPRRSDNSDRSAPHFISRQIVHDTQKNSQQQLCALRRCGNLGLPWHRQHISTTHSACFHFLLHTCVGQLRTYYTIYTVVCRALTLVILPVCLCAHLHAPRSTTGYRIATRRLVIAGRHQQRVCRCNGRQRQRGSRDHPHNSICPLMRPFDVLFDTIVSPHGRFSKRAVTRSQVSPRACMLCRNDDIVRPRKTIYISINVYSYLYKDLQLLGSEIHCQVVCGTCESI